MCSISTSSSGSSGASLRTRCSWSPVLQDPTCAVQDAGSDYKKKVQRMLAQGSTRLLVNLNDMRAYDEQQRELDPNHESIAHGLLHDPAERLPAYEAQLKDLVDAEEDSGFDKRTKAADREYHIGVEGSFGANLVSPRELRSPLLAQMVCVEGIITKAAPVRPKVSSACVSSI